MNLNASFVALSACNTANADFDLVAQDLPALASAFAVSGVPATLGTLWPVDSTTGQQVVAAVFERLHDAGGSPADALAQAQRAFLAAPPGRAWLHPRFWAPFVVLGDGGPLSDVASAEMSLTAVETLTGPGGEVLALSPSAAGTAARFIAPDAFGRPGSGLRLLGRSGETWRQVDHQARASRVLGQIGALWVAGGFETGPAGRLQPRLDACDGAGRLVKVWRGQGLSAVDAGILAATRADSGLLIVVGERTRPGEAGGGGLKVLRVGADLAPELLFQAQAPAGASIFNATLTMLGDRLLFTYTADNRRTLQPAPNLEDYEDQVCANSRMTCVELRDAHAGVILQARTLPGFAAVAAAPGAGATMLLGGSQADGCKAERKAAVLALDASLNPRSLYLDRTLGASETRALAPMARGKTFVAAYKENLFDYAPAPGAQGGAAGRLAAGRNYSTLALILDQDGRASPPKPIDAGADVLPTAALVTDGGEILLGGSLAGQAAIFHLETATAGKAAR